MRKPRTKESPCSISSSRCSVTCLRCSGGKRRDSCTYICCFFWFTWMHAIYYCNGRFHDLGTLSFFLMRINVGLAEDAGRRIRGGKFFICVGVGGAGGVSPSASRAPASSGLHTRSHVVGGRVLTLMLLVANLANTKWCKNSEKWRKPWQMGTHLKVLGESFPMNTNMTGFRWFSIFFTSSWFGRK